MKSEGSSWNRRDFLKVGGTSEKNVTDIERSLSSWCHIVGPKAAMFIESRICCY